jgi:sulfonate transport system substrate-binding protein
MLAPPRPRLRFAGVPEHFNLPFINAQVSGAFKPFADFIWTPVPGGTGAMVAAVTAGEVDVAVALTEGIMAAVVASADSPVPLRYVGGFVASPLRWLVVTGPDNAVRGLADLAARAAARGGDAGGGEGCIRVAVSRLGSGSHLMAFLLAVREGWPLGALSFHVHKDFRTMRRGACGTAPSHFFPLWRPPRNLP